jgi:ATP-binding cassette subfamily A (ABC1) protein 1
LKRSICGDSPFSIFTILNSYNRNEYLTRISDLVEEEFQDNLYDEIKRKARETLSNSTQNQQLAQLTAFIISMNRLKLVPFDRCPSRLPGYSSTIYQNSTTRSCFCQTGYKLIRSISRVTRIAFDQIRSMLLGKILYTPNTPAYVELVKKINTTFSNVDNMGQLIGNIAYLLENVLNDLNTDSIDNLFQQINQLIASFLNLNFSFEIKSLINQTKLIVEILKFIRNSIECVELNKFMSYSNEYEAVEAGLNLIDRSAFWSLIVFDNPEEVDPVTNTTKLPKILKYKIRMNAYHVHDTFRTEDRFYTYSRTDCIVCNLYFLFGFIYLQDLTEKAIIETKTNKSQNYGIIGQMHPYPCYVNDKFMNVLSRTLPLFMVLAWIYTVAMMVKDIVYEKEKRLKEFMRVMGLSNGIHWASWFITSFVTMFFIAIFLCIIIKYGKVTQFSDLSALLVFFCCFTIATISE